MIKIIKAVVIILEKFSPYYLAVTTRIKSFNEENLKKYLVYGHLTAEYAIVMQGQIIQKDNFTVETLTLYRHIYPNIQIILSTWEIEDAKLLDQLKELNVTIIRNQKPDFPGIVNVNLQIVSTVTGLQSLDDKVVKYTLKTRTDQRCCKAIDFLGYMRFLQSYFPLKNTFAIQQRLVINSRNTFKERLYGVTDMFMFGTIADMLLYWQVPPDTKKIETVLYPDQKFYIKNEVAEGYFVKHFFTQVGFNPLWTMEDSISFLSTYFIVVDQSMIDVFWFKYNRFIENEDLQTWKQTDLILKKANGNIK